jgi:Tfp pilus assembly protein PilN
MRNVEKSDWIADPKLTIIQTKNAGARRTADFSMTVRQRTPKSAEDEEQL